MPAAPLAPLSGGGGVDEHMADGPKAAVGEAASGEAPQAYTAGGVPARGGALKRPWGAGGLRGGAGWHVPPRCKRMATQTSRPVREWGWRAGGAGLPGGQVGAKKARKS